jgi:hypothetical protein
MEEAVRQQLGFFWEMKELLPDLELESIGELWAQELSRHVATQHGLRLVHHPYPILGDSWAINAKAAINGAYAKYSHLRRLVTEVSNSLFSTAKAIIIFTGVDSTLGTKDHEGRREHFQQLGYLVDRLPEGVPAFYIEPPRIDAKHAEWNRYRRSANKLLAEKGTLRRIPLPAINDNGTGVTSRRNLIDQGGMLTAAGHKYLVDQIKDFVGAEFYLSSEEQRKIVKVKCSSAVVRGYEEELPPIPLAERTEAMALRNRLDNMATQSRMRAKLLRRECRGQASETALNRRSGD